MNKLLNLAAKNVLILGMFLALCMVTGCQEGSNAAWVYGDSDVISTRIGARVEATDPSVEAGMSAAWLPDVETPVAYGLYAIYHGPAIFELPNFFTLDFLPETLSGHPYVGGKFDMDARLEESMLSPIVGFIFAGTDEAGVSAFIEYQFESFDRTQIGESKLMMGGIYKF